MFLLFAVLAALAWGANTLYAKMALDTIPRSRVMLISGIVFSAIAACWVAWDCCRSHASRVASLHPFGSAGDRYGVLAGATMAIGGVLYIIALSLSAQNQAYIVNAVAYTAPMFTLLFTVLFLKHGTGLRWDQVTAAMTSVAATCYLSFAH
jgi:uncharacterized membrane protein